MNRLTTRSFSAVMLAASVAAFVAGCGIFTVGPDYSEPKFDVNEIALPDAGYPTTNKTANGEFAPAETNDDPRVEITRDDIVGWWRHFNDPILTGLVEGVVSNNITYLMASERLEQARWRLLGSAADSFPQIGLNGSASQNEYGSATPTGSGAGRKIHRNLFRGGFDATWEIDLFGGVRRGIESAYASAQSSSWSLADTWVSLTAEMGATYINLRTVQQRLRVPAHADGSGLQHVRPVRHGQGHLRVLLHQQDRREVAPRLRHWRRTRGQAGKVHRRPDSRGDTASSVNRGGADELDCDPRGRDARRLP